MVELRCLNKFIKLLLCVILVLISPIFYLKILVFLFGSCQFNVDRFAWLNQGCCRYILACPFLPLLIGVNLIFTSFAE